MHVHGKLTYLLQKEDVASKSLAWLLTAIEMNYQLSAS